MTSEERCAVFQTAAAFSETGAIVYSWDSDEPWPECEYIDGFAAERAGIEAEAFMRDPSRFFSSDPLNTAFIHAARDRALAEDPSRYEVPWAAASGQIYWLECSVQQLGRKPDGRLRFAVISRDVDERRHMAEERALLADAVEQAPDGVLIFRVDREHPLWPPIVYANAGFCAMTGYTKDEIASGTYPQIFDERSDVDSIKDCAQRVFAGEQVAYELILLRKDKTSFWAEARAHLLESPPEYGV